MGKMTNMSTSPLNQGSGFVIGIHMRGDGVFGFGIPQCRGNIFAHEHYLVINMFIRHSVTPVTVLQFQNRWYEGQKLTLYLYINIEVFLGYGKPFREL